EQCGEGRSRHRRGEGHRRGHRLEAGGARPSGGRRRCAGGAGGDGRGHPRGRRRGARHRPRRGGRGGRLGPAGGARGLVAAARHPGQQCRHLAEGGGRQGAEDPRDAGRGMAAGAGRQPDRRLPRLPGLPAAASGPALGADHHADQPGGAGEEPDRGRALHGGQVRADGLRAQPRDRARPGWNHGEQHRPGAHRHAHGARHHRCGECRLRRQHPARPPRHAGRCGGGRGFPRLRGGGLPHGCNHRCRRRQLHAV
ncbi:MAG: 3-oxoacyl-[acyl-carrier protein] reductase, partial [uncultured Craurococcus sp.]